MGANNETVTGVFIEDRAENSEGEDTNVQLRTQSNADTILGVATNPAGSTVLLVDLTLNYGSS